MTLGNSWRELPGAVVLHGMKTMGGSKNRGEEILLCVQLEKMRETDEH